VPPATGGILPKNILKVAGIYDYVVVGMLRTKSAHSLGEVWSIATTVITSPFISEADKVSRTNMEAAGDTVGRVARSVRAPPSIETLKSPAAIVGLDLKSPALA
jgi:hypothetical protein